MKITPNGQADLIQLPRTAWGRFWLLPTDPTVLGFMRIVTGLLAFYVHLAYCYDLGAFFGPDAFVDTQSANRARQEQPMQSPSWKDWDPRQPMVILPVLPDRRAPVFGFLQGLPDDKSERDETLDYLYKLLENYGSSDTPEGRTLTSYGLALLKDAAKLDPDQRASMLTSLTKKEFVAKELPMTLPLFFFYLNVTIDERVRLWRSALRLSDFLWDLPAFQDANYQETERQISHVLNWMAELSASQRDELATYLHKLPAGEEGRRTLEYLKYWRADPREAYTQGTATFSIWFHLTDPRAMWVAHICVLIIFVLFTLGLFTRVTSVLAWLAALQYIHRSQFVLFGMDTMMNILLIYLMIGPSGAALSVDRLIARYRAAKAIFRAGGKPVPWAEQVLAGPQPSATANFAVRLFQVHFCIMYTIAGLAKLKGNMWWDSSAAWYTLGNPEFTPMNFPIYENTMRAIASVKPLMQILFAVFVYFTFVVEIGLPFLIWTRLRPIFMCLAMFLHAGIAISMGLTCFQLFMMSMLLAFLPGSVIRNRVVWEAGTGPKVIVRFSGRNPSHARTVALVRALDLTGQVTCRDDAAKQKPPDEVELAGDDGKTYSGGALIPKAFRTLLFARTVRWLLYVPGAAWLLRPAASNTTSSAATTERPIAVTNTGKSPTAS